MSRWIARAVASVAMVMAACSSGGPQPSPTATSTVSPPANHIADSMVVGKAHLKVTGDVVRTVDWDLQTTANEPEMTIVAWGQGLDSFFLVAGPGALTKGGHDTSAAFSVNMVLGTKDDDQFVSQSGECRVTLTQVEGGLDGRIRCDQVTSPNGATTIKLTGTFSAGPR